MEEGGEALEPPGARGAGAPEAELGQERRRGPAEQPLRYVRRGGGQPRRAELQRGLTGARRECVQGRVLPRVRTARPVAFPRAMRSIRAAAYGRRSSVAASPASAASRSAARSVSTDIREVSTGRSASVADRMTPVSPSPPAVASNRSVPGSTVRTVPSAVSRSRERTCRVKEPALGWLRPWTSAPIAPPTVTNRVEGVTGTNRPSGSSSSISRCRLTPASQTTVPAAGSIAWTRSSALMSITEPPAFCAASPWARPSPRATTPRGPRPVTAIAASS